MNKYGRVTNHIKSKQAKLEESFHRVSTEFSGSLPKLTMSSTAVVEDVIDVTTPTQTAVCAPDSPPYNPPSPKYTPSSPALQPEYPPLGFRKERMVSTPDRPRPMTEKDPKTSPQTTNSILGHLAAQNQVELPENLTTTINQGLMQIAGQLMESVKDEAEDLSNRYTFFEKKQKEMEERIEKMQNDLKMQYEEDKKAFYEFANKHFNTFNENTAKTNDAHYGAVLEMKKDFEKGTKDDLDTCRKLFMDSTMKVDECTTSIQAFESKLIERDEIIDRQNAQIESLLEKVKALEEGLNQKKEAPKKRARSQESEEPPKRKSPRRA